MMKWTEEGIFETEWPAGKRNWRLTKHSMDTVSPINVAKTINVIPTINAIKIDHKCNNF